MRGPAGASWTRRRIVHAGVAAGSRPNDFPLDLVQAAMFDNMDRWLRSGQPPPPSAFIETATDGSTRVDEWGNAAGGVRYPQVAVPVARYGVGSGGPCLLFGYTAPLTPGECGNLYGDHANYVALVRARTQELVASRLLLPEGAARLVAAARADTSFT